MATAEITELRPKTGNAERQRRYRARRRDPGETGQAVEIVKSVTPALTVLDVPARRLPWSVWPLAFTTVGLMAVSLTHLSDGVTQLTLSRHGRPGRWQSASTAC